MMMAWQPQPLFAFHEHTAGTFFSPLGSSAARRRGCVLDCGRIDREQKLGVAVPNYSHRVYERIPRLIARPCNTMVKANKKKRTLVSSVVNEVGWSGSQESGSVASEDELKDQLEALEEEALHVRDRYNNARARFMRLTEAAQQLRQRASIDIDLGDEDGARKVLMEKQKVIRAAELSKKRAQLLEELSSKLGEAISRKESQLIVVLSSPELSSDKESTVRIIAPKGEHLISFDLGVDREEHPTGRGTAEASQIVDDFVDLSTDSIKALPAEAKDVEGGSKQVVPVNEGKADVANDKGYINEDDLYGKEQEVIGRIMELDSDNKNLSLGNETVADSGHTDLQSGGSLMLENELQGQALTWDLSKGPEEAPGTGMASAHSDYQNFDNSNNSEAGPSEGGDKGSREGDSKSGYAAADIDKLGVTSQDTGAGNVDVLGQKEATEGSGEIGFSDGRHMLFEDYMLDVDHQTAAIESHLRIFMVTAVSSNKDTVLKMLQLVGELLEQVQSLRARISEVVREYHKKEVQ